LRIVLKGTDIKEKVFWSRKYNIIDDFIFKTLEKFLVRNISFERKITILKRSKV